MSFLRHREPHQADERLKMSKLLNKRARPFGHALAHPADESPVGYSWRVALQHCPLPLHQPRLILSKRSVEGNNFFDPVLLWLNFLSHPWGALQSLCLLVSVRLKLKLHRLKPDGILHFHTFSTRGWYLDFSER
jgi:hypothetical protein